MPPSRLNFTGPNACRQVRRWPHSPRHAALSRASRPLPFRAASAWRSSAASASASLAPICAAAAWDAGRLGLILGGGQFGLGDSQLGAQSIDPALEHVLLLFNAVHLVDRPVSPVALAHECSVSVARAS